MDKSSSEMYNTSCISYRPASYLAHGQLGRWENVDGSRWKFVERGRKKVRRSADLVR